MSTAQASTHEWL